MITKEKSQKMKQLKYLLIIPLLFGMLIYSSCTNDAQADIDEINNVIENEIVYKKGWYYEKKNGIKIFTGSKLEGQVVPFNEMSKREKEVFNNFKNSKIEYNLIIDENGDRVHFIKIPEPPAPMPPINSNEDDGAVPFAKIEIVPIFPGCEGTNEELRTCLQEKITAHVSANFNSKLASGLGLEPGIKRIFVLFIIDKEGNITGVKSRAPHKALEEEAIRVINSLPKMKPGSYLGENVGVKYSLPIAFKVEDDNLKNEPAKKVILNSKNTKNPKNPPLVLLNGKEITKEEMEKIDPKSIKSMNVLKDEKAINKYGQKGKDGVIEISLK